MPDGIFHFKQFSIRQDKCAMKVGTDAVLLGSWIKLDGTEKNLLDIGTGTGVLALMVAQRSNAMIDAIDVDELAAVQARENADHSKWAERIQIFPLSLQDFIIHQKKKYDHIISNPPYFDQAFKAPEAARNAARHRDVSLNFEEILSGSTRILSDTGKLSVILPFTESDKFLDKAVQLGFHLNRLCNIITRIGKPGKRVLIELGLSAVKSEYSELILKNEDLSHHRDYLELTKEYYPWDYISEE